MKRTLLATVLVMGTLASREALAVEPVDIEIGAKAGYGLNPSGYGDPNPFGVGLGLRGGVVLAGFYGGVSIVNYFGSGEGYSQHALVWGLEAGYGFKVFDMVTIRPQCGLGDMTMWRTFTPSGSIGATNSQNNFYLEPGVTALVGIGAVAFAGVDLNLLVVPGVNYQSDYGGIESTWVTPTFHLQFGLKF